MSSISRWIVSKSPVENLLLQFPHSRSPPTNEFLKSRSNDEISSNIFDITIGKSFRNVISSGNLSSCDSISIVLMLLFCFILLDLNVLLRRWQKRHLLPDLHFGFLQSSCFTNSPQWFSKLLKKFIKKGITTPSEMSPAKPLKDSFIGLSSLPSSCKIPIIVSSSHKDSISWLSSSILNVSSEDKEDEEDEISWSPSNWGIMSLSVEHHPLLIICLE